MTTEPLLEVLNNLPEGCTEIMFHPGKEDAALRREHNWGYEWQGELDALKAQKVKAALDSQGIVKINFGALAIPKKTETR